MTDTNTVKCPGCGGPLPYDSMLGKWKCPQCGGEWDDEQILLLTRDSDLDTKSAEQSLSVYRCQNCGAEVVGSDTTSATMCAYCGSPIVLKGRLEGQFRPKLIIPFTHTKEQAMEAFRKVLSKERFVPSEFTDRDCLEKIAPVYIPFWLYSGHLTKALSGYYDVQSSSRSGNYVTTRTTRWHVEMEGEANYVKVPADGSAAFDDKLMDSIEPYDYSGLKPFNYAYLSGFMAEKFDVPAQEAQERAAARMLDDLTSRITAERAQSFTTTSSSHTQEIGQPDYALLPVWIFNTKFNGKNFVYAMNGQTGKMVGETPLSKSKMWKFGAMVCLGTMLFFELIFCLYYILGFA